MTAAAHTKLMAILSRPSMGRCSAWRCCLYHRPKLLMAYVSDMARRRTTTPNNGLQITFATHSWTPSHHTQYPTESTGRHPTKGTIILLMQS